MNILTAINRKNMVKKITAIGVALFLIGLTLSIGYQVQTGNYLFAQATYSNSVSASCYVSASSTSVGSTVTYTVNATGASSYTYSWSGTDNLTGTGTSTTKIYNATGTKTATVYVTSGNATASAQCSVNVTAPATPACVSNPEVDLTGSLLTGGNARVTNSSENCSYKIGLATYKVFAGGIENQVLFDSDVKTIAPKSTTYLQVDLPACKYQIDLFYGDLIQTFRGGARYGGRLIQGGIRGDGYCSTPTTTPTTGTLKIVKTVINDNGGTKQVSDFALFIENTQVTSGQVLTLSANTYSVRENNLSGYTAGSWGGDCSTDGRVTLRAGENKTCTITNNDNAPVVIPTLGGSCIANDTTLDINQTVTYTANATGGTGTYSYSWSGDAIATGTSRTHSTSYGSTGTKSATVRITSGNQTIYKNCTVTVTQASVIPTLNGSCAANDSTLDINQTVTYSASATGGTGTYTYAWTGDAITATGTARTHATSYGSAGTKHATVRITSGSQTITKNCTVAVMEAPVVNNPEFTGSCSVNPSSALINESIIYTAHASGGTGSYTYSWSGWDNLSGTSQVIQKMYGTPGTKTATVAITSGGQTIYKNCQTEIHQPMGGGSVGLTASCAANITSGYAGDTVTWNANASGGNGSYSYSWTGTDNLSGSTQSINKNYPDVGSKFASVTVYSNGQSTTQTCNVYISPRTTTYVPPTPPTGSVYLSQVPYTGIGDNLKLGGFILALLGWSGLISYLIIRRKAAKAGMINSQPIVNPSRNPSIAFAGGIGVVPAFGKFPTTDSRLDVLKAKTQTQKTIPILANISHDIKLTPYNYETKVVSKKPTAPINLPTEPVQRIVPEFQPVISPVAAAPVTNTANTYDALYSRINAEIAAQPQVQEYTYTAPVAEEVAPVIETEPVATIAAPVQEQVQPQESNFIESLEIEARAMNTLVSADGLELIAQASNYDLRLAKTTLAYLIKLYQGARDPENRWGVLNTEMIKHIVARDMEVAR